MDPCDPQAKMVVGKQNESHGVSVASYLSVDDYSSSSHLLPLLTEKSWNDNDDDDKDYYVLQRKYLPIPFQISSSENKEASITLHFLF